MLRGSVHDRAGQPIGGVRISILGHPEFGQTLSRADGEFDLVVNGGGYLTVTYQHSGYLPAQRQVKAPWQDYVVLEDVILIPRDGRVTQLDLTQSGASQLAQGSPVSDGDGTRQPALLLPAGTQVSRVLPDGSSEPLSSLSLRFTEYTVGPEGPRTMPAPLPPTSGYTYALEISADEATTKLNGKDVLFDRPVPFYVDNFLNFPVGGEVRVGYYDSTKGAWIPYPNGRIIQILSVSGGLADVDVDGSGHAADTAALAALGITDDERGRLAGLYAPGKSFWRVLLSHLSTWDCNWPFGPPADAIAPGSGAEQPPTADSQKPDDPCTATGSTVECESQVLGETLPLTGSPFSLHYRSDRVPDRLSARDLLIPLTGSSVPPSLKRVDLAIDIAGRRFEQTFPAQANQTTTFLWDGIDSYGRTVTGATPASVTITFVYDAAYQQPVAGRSFGVASGVAISGSRTRQEIYLSRTYTASVGAFDVYQNTLGGWSLEVHHRYDPIGRLLYQGDGSRRSAEATANNLIITTVAGGGNPPDGLGDGGPATEASLNPFDIAVGADGSLFIAGSYLVRRVGPDGIITTVAGGGNPPDGLGDGGPATEASLTPGDIAVGADGSLYISEVNVGRIRRVGPDGIITTVAGGGDPPEGLGDGGPATAASLTSPRGIAVGADGSLYIADYYEGRIRRVGPDGIITTVAGGGEQVGDGGPATEAYVGPLNDVAVGADGSLYVAEAGFYYRMLRVGTDGIITTAAGSRENLWGSGGDGGPPTAALLRNPESIAIGADGSLYIADEGNYRISQVFPLFAGFNTEDIAIASSDGRQLYLFSPEGRHLRTLDTRTGAVLYSFAYDSAGRLIGVTDVDGNTTNIERDTDGHPTALVTPYGQRTQLGVDANGYLNRLTNPAGETYQMTYTSGGLLTQFTDPRGNASHFTYDAQGRLSQDADAAGGSQNLARVELTRGYTTTRTTALGRATAYSLEDLTTGDRLRTVIQPDGTQSQSLAKTDGTTQLSEPDGTQTTSVEGPDPRFGMQAPVVTSTQVATGGQIAVTTRTRTAVLGEPGHPLSLVTLTDSATLNGRTATSVYDAANRRETTTSAAGRSSIQEIDAKGHTTLTQIGDLAPISYAYDSHGRLQDLTQGSGAEARITTFGYDGNGYLSSITDALGRQAAFGYDLAGRVTNQTLPDGRTIQYGYDAKGNQTAVTPPGRPVHDFEYTPVDLQAKYQPPALPSPATQYAYNLDQELTQIDRPDGQSLLLGYDLAGRLGTLALPTGTIGYGYHPASGKVVVTPRDLPGRGRVALLADPEGGPSA